MTGTKLAPEVKRKTLDPSITLRVGQQVQAIAEYERAVTSGVSLEMLREIQTRAASGSSEAVPADGGFATFSEFANEIWANVIKESPILSRCKQYPISNEYANGLKIPGYDEQSRVDGSRWGGVQGYWANEGGTVTVTKPKYRLIELTLKKLLAFKHITNELLADAAALGIALEDAYYEELKFKMEYGALLGDGAGQPLGILNPGNNALIQVAKESGQTNATINVTNITKMWNRMPGSRRKRAIWLVNQDAESQFDLFIATGAETSVFEYSDDPDNQPYSLLKGRPVVPVEYLPALGTLGDILLVDMNEYIVASKQGISGEISTHLKFLTDESTLRCRWRVDGQPTMHAPVTQFNGGSTQSPYVSLAAR